MIGSPTLVAMTQSGEIDSQSALAEDVDDLDLTPAELLRADGPLPRGSGLGPSVFAVGIALLSFMAVVAFHFPQYLTTPDLRHGYDVEMLRKILFVSLVVGAAVAIVNLIMRRRWQLNLIALSFITAAVALGGSAVKVKDFPDHTPYIGLDLFIIDLLTTAAVFIVAEKLFALKRDQPIFRRGWQLDLGYFFGNDLIVGAVLVVVNTVTRDTLQWVPNGGVQRWVSGLPLWIAVPFAMLVADFSQYWTHRANHQIKPLWKMHAVHHSTEALDWMSGSRLHLGEILQVRIMVILPVLALGFSKGTVDIYVLIVSTQSVFIHSNMRSKLGPLRYIIATPNFHHWHHSQDHEGIDKNYAAHFSFLDYLFGTAASADRDWPDRYGVLGDYVPQTYLGQMTFPFTKPKLGVNHANE